MSRDWEPDVALDLLRAHGIVGGQFPRYSDQQPRFLGRGWDNICVVYPDQMVFRLPTRKMGGELVKSEMEALPFLADRLPLPIPKIRYIGRPTVTYPYPFMGYPYIPGNTSDSVEWNSDARSSAACAIGAFLRDLHRLEINGTTLAGLPQDSMQKTDPGALLKKIDARIQSILQRQPEMLVRIEKVYDGLALLAERASPVSERTIVHGDLYARHLLADQTGHITGVIDWGDVHWGDPLGDLSVAFSFFEASERDLFWSAYGLVPAVGDQRRAALRAAMYGFALLSYGLEESDIAAKEMGSTILDRIRAF